MLAGRYKIVRRLGSGGMATVFLAEDQRLMREVAVKRMHAESPDEVATRFQREAELGASLNHPNIVSIYDIETDDENVLIVMEYVPGGTLKDALARGPLPVDAALKVLKGVASALDYAHEHDVTHRDVKPPNVLLDSRGRAKLADLGIATAAEVTSITRTGAVMGTAAYMAPERLDGERGGPAADIYSLAAVAYEALTGHKARQGRSAVEIAHMVVSAPPPDLRMRMPEAPQEAADVLARGMARDPAERPATAGELVRELCEAFERADATDPAAADPGTAEERTAATAAIAQPAPTPARARPAMTRTRPATGAGGGPSRRWLLPLGGLIAALLVVALILALAGGDDSDPGAGSGDQAAEESGRGDVGGESDSSGEQDGSGGGEQGGGDQGGGGAAGGNPGAADSPPATAVRDFYTRAAEDDFEGAWELAGPEARAQFGSYDRFVGTLDTLERIEFPTLQVAAERGNSATVRLETVATHTNRVDRCSGTAEVASSGGEWRLGRISVDCSSGQAGSGKGPDEGRPVPPKKPKKDK